MRKENYNKYGPGIIREIFKHLFAAILYNLVAMVRFLESANFLLYVPYSLSLYSEPSYVYFFTVPIVDLFFADINTNTIVVRVRLL